MSILNKFLIGLANANPNYGIQPRGHLTAKSLQEIWNTGVRRVDSAEEYVNAEKIISESGLNWRVQTKFRVPNIYNSFWDLLQAAKFATRDSHVECLLIHTTNLYKNPRSNHVVADLKRVSEMIGVPKVGISVYRPIELENLENWEELDVVQFPHNPLDTHCLDWLIKYKQNKFPTLQARSIFLQGLLISSLNESYVLPVALLDAVLSWKQWITELDIDASLYCTRFVFGNAKIDEIVVGIDSAEQLKKIIINAVDSKALPRYPVVIQEEITDARRWTN